MKIKLQKYLKTLFPIARSITGKNNRLTLNILNEITPIKIKSIPSGKKIYDWTVPPEWELRSAWIKDAKNNILIDYKNNNLHVVNYSQSVNKWIFWKNLKLKIYKHKKLKNAIPYRTTYYKKDWGFCVNWKQYELLKKNKKKLFVKIDSSFNKKGKLNYGEIIIKGKFKKEILISTYLCHPSMANDNLSGILLTAFLAKHLKNKKKLKWTYRIIFIPETIGAIGYLNQNEKKLKNIDFGINICNCGGRGKIGYKQSWNMKHLINELTERTFKENGEKFITYPFDINGSDERQFSSPGFRINIITITKDKYYEYPQYHSSLDNLNFVKAENLEKTLNIYKKLINNIENLEIYKRNQENGEIMLSKHKLNRSHGGEYLPDKFNNKIDLLLWILFYIDGKVDIETIRKKLNLKEKIFHNLIKELVEKKIIRHVY